MIYCQVVLGYKMFFIEYIIKKFTQKKEKDVYNPVSIEEKQDYEGCEHIYMPIDSDGETLSCTKCGTLCKKSEIKDELKKKNFFMQNE